MKTMPDLDERELELAFTYPPKDSTVSEPVKYLEENGLSVARFQHRVLSEAGWLPVIQYAVTYNPVARQADAPTQFIAKWQTEHGAQVSNLLSALWNAGFDGRAGFAVSQPLGYVPFKNILLQGQASGVPLLNMLNRSPAELKYARKAGRWLGKFHNTKRLPVFGPTVQEEIARIGECARQASEHAPSHGKRILALASEIERTQRAAASPRVPTHGDYHPKNIFVERDCLTVIDFDRYAASHRERDLGFFMAQSMTMPRRRGKDLSRAAKWNAAFLDGYARVTASPDPALLHSYIVSALLEVIFYKLYVRPVADRAFLADWLTVCEKLL